MKNLIGILIIIAEIVVFFVSLLALYKNYYMLIPIISLIIIGIFLYNEAVNAYDEAINAQISDSEIRKITTDFFYYWHNASGNDTREEFDRWWKKNKNKYIAEKKFKTHIKLS